MEWLGQAKIAFTHSPSPLKLKTKDGETTDLLRIAEESTPPCHLNPTLFNGHVQTMWTTTNKGGPELYFKRKVFEAEDPTYHGSFAVDFSCAPNDENDPSLYPRTTYFSDNEFASIGSLDSRPMLVTLHGLSGGSYEIYLRNVLAPLVGEGGWEACVVTSRGCARHNLTTPILYNARATWDTRQTVKWLRKTFPNRPLFGLGFSLGANIITNYIGEEGDACELKAAVVISSPWNLDVSNIALQRSWLGREVYSKALAASLKKIFERQSGMMAQIPGLNMERIRKVTYLHEFDREVQTQAWGYPTESAYYRDASSCDALVAARIPVFAINATDDPVSLDMFQCQEMNR